MGTPHPTPHRPDQDKQPSIQVRMAESMLRHGRAPSAVAKATKVPLALVELINEHLDPTPASPSRSRATTHDRAPTPDPPDPHPSPGLDPVASSDAPRDQQRRDHTLRTALLGWVTSTTLLAAAGIFHLPALTAASLVLTLVLVTTLIRTVNPRPTPPTDRD